MEKKLNKKEIAELLGKSYSTIKKWNYKKMYEELKKNCWEIVDIAKEGRNTFYFLEYAEQNFDIYSHMEEEFNVKNGEDFVNYSKMRIEGAEKNEPLSRSQICKHTNTKERTANRYDNKLIEKGVMKKDDYYYIRKEGTKETLVCEEEYHNFWRENKAVKIAFEQLGERVAQGGITLKEYNYLYEQLRQQQVVFYFKIRKFLVNKSNPIYNLIKNN